MVEAEFYVTNREHYFLLYSQVQEEEKRSKLPANWEAKRRRLEWELSDQKSREEADKNGLNYDIVKNMSKLCSFLLYFVRFGKVS